MADPGYLSNAELANQVVALVQKYNVFTDDQMDFFTSADDTVVIHNPNGDPITVPSLKSILEAAGPVASGDLSVYDSVEEGVASVIDGAYFFVSIVNGTYLGLFKRSANLGIEIGRYPSSRVDNSVNDLASAMEHADAIMMTPFNEFDLDTVKQMSNSGNGFNTVMDEYVNNLQFDVARANIEHTVADDLGAMPSIKTVMVWTQWFSLCDSTEGLNPGVVQPAINGGIYGKLLNTNQWMSGNVTAPNALKLQGDAGGSQNDMSMIRGMKYMQARGYDIGMVPIVLGWVNQAGLPNSQSLVWRGFFRWDTTAKFQTWINSYKAFLVHYINLFQANGISPTRWLVGSEFDRIITVSTPEQWGIFVEACKELAGQIKAAFPACKVTYAANYSDYGVGGKFRLDALWSHPNIDEVGIEWYFRLSDNPNVGNEGLIQGQMAGEDVDYTYNLSDDNQRKLIGSNGRGKLDETRVPMGANAGIKNVQGFWNGCHYIEKFAGSLAMATPTPGFSADYAPFNLKTMQGTGQVIAPADSPLTSGQHPEPFLRSTYFQTNGSTTWGEFKTPVFTGGNQSSWRMEVDFQGTQAPSGNYARPFRLGGAIEFLVDTGTLKFGIGPDGNQYFADIGPFNTAAHSLVATLDRNSGMLTIVYDGITSQYSIPVAQRSAIPSDTTAYLGGYNTNSNMAAMRFYKLGLTFVRDGITWGGTFWFDESYAGTRTAWVPRMKKLSATELGYASISGTSVEPSQFVYADIGTTPPTLPSFIDDTTRALFNSFFARSWYPAQIYASYGSSFNYDPFEQAAAIRETCRFMAALRRRGAFESICIYNIDARPSKAFTAILQNKFYYSDAPTMIFSHAVNGKLAGGSTFFHELITKQGKIA
ncbi:possible host specificity factor [Xanthomonas phage Xp15]|uniref:Possible host specificity factor n=1 Tax=Xanthomonas phage Xp15 TaxID=322855 RepID=Q52PQ2_9CAUD|nr:possible host specificity factor [Xanthomonas phage Xp15]AAX84865.1 possible host specificity factor [Xanthomonas phage Xp15]